MFIISTKSEYVQHIYVHIYMYTHAHTHTHTLLVTDDFYIFSLPLVFQLGGCLSTEPSLCGEANAVLLNSTWYHALNRNHSCSDCPTIFVHASVPVLLLLPITESVFLILVSDHL